MPLRSRSPTVDVSDRVGAVLGCREPATVRLGGWVPEQPGLAPAPAEPDVVAAGTPDPGFAPAPAEPCVVPTGTPNSDLARPPGPVVTGRGLDPPPAASAPTPEGGSLPTVRGLLASGRLDPGRRGALALALVGVVAAAVAGVVLLRGRPSEQPLTVPAVAGAVASSSGPEVVVDVAGRVRRPGLVRLPVGARVDDALRAAGGPLPGATTAGLNLARKLADGEQVLVGVTVGPGAAAGAAKGGLLDLNSATVQDFDALPGIGPVLAERIVSWRTEHGRFASVDQLREVSGIGESKYQAMKSKVQV